MSLINLYFRYSVVSMIDIYIDQSHFRPEDTTIDQIDDEVNDEDPVVKNLTYGWCKFNIHVHFSLHHARLNVM